MKTTGFRLLALLLVSVLPSTPSRADEGSPRDQLIALATIEVMADLCKLDLTDDQEQVIATRRSALVDQGATDAAEITSIHDGLATALAGEVSEGLCRPKGPAMLDFRKQVDALKP